MTTVLVTGASGFIGGALVTALGEAGYMVRGLGRAAQATMPWHCADFGEPSSLRGCCRNIDVVCHLAGVAHTRAPAAVHERITVAGTQALLAEAQAAGVKGFIFLSTIKVLCSDDDYARSRQAAEHLIGAVPGMATTILRPALVYGPGVKGNLGRLLALTDRGWPLPVPDLPAIRSLIHRDDIVAVILALLKSGSRGGRYVVTDGGRYMLRAIYREMCKACGRTPAPPLPRALLPVLGRCGDSMSSIVRRPLPFTSSALATLIASCYSDEQQVWRDLGLAPRWSLTTALPAMVAAHRAAL